EIAGFWRRRPQVKANFRLNTRVDKSSEVHRRATSLCMDECAVVDGSPNWFVHAISGPDRPIGEADLASDRAPSCSQAVRVQSSPGCIAVARCKALEAIAKRRYFPRKLVEADQLVGKHQRENATQDRRPDRAGRRGL